MGDNYFQFELTIVSALLQVVSLVEDGKSQTEMYWEIFVDASLEILIGHFEIWVHNLMDQEFLLQLRMEETNYCQDLILQKHYCSLWNLLSLYYLSSLWHLFDLCHNLLSL